MRDDPPIGCFALAAADAISYRRAMPKRIAAVICLLLIGLSLGGCTHCGWLWDQGPRSCRSDSPRT
jgi:hypothetical protein